MQRKIAIIGLGYVGLPLAVAFGRRFPQVIGFDINARRIAELKEGIDHTRELSVEEIRASKLVVSDKPADIADATLYIVTVPTPIDANHQPDLMPLRKASQTVGKVLKRGDIVVYESTVYPGVTEEFCGPILAEHSGLVQGKDFKLGYSPERINPGDKVHRLETITKVVSGEDAQTLDLLAEVYGSVVEAGIHRAPSIKAAEAAKVIENTQRDLNIALMNELAIIFDHVGLRTADVLAAARTKWNFMPFGPGLVGGHCIGVDPYYLTALAERLGYHPQVVLAGRRINDGMGQYVARKTVKLLALAGKKLCDAKVGILGLTFKENVRDVRNSRVPDIVAELKEFGIKAHVHDPMVDAEEAKEEYDITLVDEKSMHGLDALILAVPHEQFLQRTIPSLINTMPKQAVLVDIKSVLKPADYTSLHYWSL